MQHDVKPATTSLAEVSRAILATALGLNINNPKHWTVRDVFHFFHFAFFKLLAWSISIKVFIG
jgi:hypothetical protein